MSKKRFSIFNLDEEYIPRSVWNAGFGELGEMQEEPLYTTEENNPQNGMWSGLDRPQKGDVNTQPNNRFDYHQDKDTPGLILYANKKGTQPDNFPRRENNILKAVHQRITNKNIEVPVQRADTVNDTLKTDNGVLPEKATHSLSQSSRGYIDAPGMMPAAAEEFIKNMTPAQKDSIDRVYNGYAKDARRDLQKLSGEKIKPIKAVIFDPDMEGRAPIQYKNDTITAKRGFLERGENMKRSLLVHEMQHHADKDNLPFRWGDGQNGKVVYNEQTSYPGVPVFKNPDPIYTDEEIQKTKGLQTEKDRIDRLTQGQYESTNTNFIYFPSNHIQAEINALYSQLEAHLRGLIPISEENIDDILLNLATWKTGMKKALDYQKEKGYAPTGYPFKK